MNVTTSFPPGFFDRYISGPCNNALCVHQTCWQMRAELRAFAEEQLRKHVKHAKRKAKVRR